MPSAYTLVYPYPLNPEQEKENPKPSYAIVADESEAHYVNAPTGLDDRRIERLLKMAKKQPTTALEYTRLLLQNTGYVYAGPLNETETLIEAINAAKEALSVVE